jgi:hypothetical protein
MKKYSNGILVDMTETEISQHNKDVVEENSSATKLIKIKNTRYRLLQETDWWVLRGNMTTAQSNYRQALRDIPSTYSESDYDSLLARDSNGNLTHTIWSKP